jgi:hypothetical protein
MNSIIIRARLALAYAAPYCTALLGWAVTVFWWAWAAVKVSLKPFWVPAVTLARNPLTAVVVCFLVVGSYFVGDRVRAVRDYVKVSEMLRAHKKELAEKDLALRANAALLLKEKADLVAELDALKKQNDELEAKTRSAKPAAVKIEPAKAAAKTKVAPAAKPWGLF